MPWIPTGERSELLTPTAMERVSLCGDEKLTAFLELTWLIRG
jgi:hypothetical protein